MQTYVDVINPPKKREDTSFEKCFELKELESSENLLKLLKSKDQDEDQVTKNQKNDDFFDRISDDYNEYLYGMVQYWQEYGFFDKRKPITNIVADISQITLKYVTQTHVDVEEEEDDIEYENEEDYFN